MIISCLCTSSARRSGWTKIRDAFVIPFAVQIGLYIGKQILQTVQQQTGFIWVKQNNNIGEL